jgi:hypothetical protein
LKKADQMPTFELDQLLSKVADQTQLPSPDSEGYWHVTTIKELVELAKNPDVNINNLIKDVVNFLTFGASREVLKWKDDGIERIDVNCAVTSDQDSNEVLDYVKFSVEPKSS